MILAAFLYLVGALVTALAPVFAVMVIGRFVFGIGIGLVKHNLLFSFTLYITYQNIMHAINAYN